MRLSLPSNQAPPRSRCSRGIGEAARPYVRRWGLGGRSYSEVRYIGEIEASPEAVQKLLTWIIHDECRPRRKPLILLSYAAGADFVEFSVTRSSDWPFPWSWPASGQPGA